MRPQFSAVNILSDCQHWRQVLQKELNIPKVGFERLMEHSQNQRVQQKTESERRRRVNIKSIRAVARVYPRVPLN